MLHGFLDHLETLSALKGLFSTNQMNQIRASPTGFPNFAVNTSCHQPLSHLGGYVGNNRIQLLLNELEKT